jgi:ferric-dicitrate binding protein FerR (iron transport regulator)
MAEQKNNQTPVGADFQETWEMAGKYAYPEQGNDEASWNKLQAKISQSQLTVEKKSIFSRRWAVAAAVAAIITGSVAIMMNISGSHTTEAILAVTRAGEVKEITLSDGSVVRLNANSKLTIAADFNSDNRHIELEGQAHFEVSRNEELPFTVNSNHLNVTVLGTGFTVTDYPQETPAVEVSYGKVRVEADKKQITLTKNMVARLSNGELNSSVQSSSCTWVNGKLVFSNASLSEISTIFKNRYGKGLIWKNSSDKNRLFSGSFADGTPPQAMVETIEKALTLKLGLE